MTRDELIEGLKVDGKWISYPDQCTHPNRYEGDHPEPAGYICHHDDGYFCEHRQRYVLDIINQHVKEVVGGDESEKYNDVYIDSYPIESARNELRAEQRKRAGL